MARCRLGSVSESSRTPLTQSWRTTRPCITMRVACARIKGSIATPSSTSIIKACSSPIGRRVATRTWSKKIKRRKLFTRLASGSERRERMRTGTQAQCLSETNSRPQTMTILLRTTRGPVALPLLECHPMSFPKSTTMPTVRTEKNSTNAVSEQAEIFF